jgi:hypothetical protein
MDRNDPRHARAVGEQMRAALIMLCFGFGVLAFLVAIDRPEWFHIQPGTATAAAMVRAADRKTELASPSAPARAGRE